LRILLTGADGFTGRPFSEHARAKGHEIVALRADLTDAAALHREVQAVEPEAVVHLAGISFVGHEDENAFYAVNVIGTTHLLDALARLPRRPACVLLSSSANVYGNSECSPLTETQAPSPVNHYAMSKLAMEYMARNYTDRLHLVITRPFNYTGPGQDINFVIPKLAKHFASRAPSIALGNLDVEREFNDVRLVCDAYLRLLECGEAGEIYNVCSNRPFTLRHVLDVFTELTGHRIRVEIDPRFVRPNEVHRLCGSADKLERLLAAHGAKLQVPSLEDTLRQMLASAQGSG
jgi:nucleoside-diphosphate-sugar epimerase